MPLQDRFGKKTTKPQPEVQKPSRARHLNHAPTMDDLVQSLQEAQASVRQPVIISWKRSANGPVSLLTVIRNTEEGEPTWMLHSDDKNNLTVLWSYSTSDPGLILNLISDQGQEQAKAVIPDSLRPQASPDSQPQFFENYEIINTIGHGGMGIIYKAKDRTDGGYVALKVLRADLMVDPSNVERFKHEASAVRSLQHPNLIQLREYGLSKFGQPFLAMDYLEGVELRAVLDKVGRLEIPTFVNIFTQICEALAYAHEQGLVHRDLKPGNIMLVNTPEGKPTVKIIDFGIAKSVREQPGTVSSITTYGHFLGSPAYMSPEQCGGAVLDSRSDIYSLGCVMYEAVTGVLPFKYDNVLKVIMAQVNDAPASFATVCPDVEIPRVIEDIIFTSLAKNPRDRYQSTRQLAEDLWEFAARGSATIAAGSLSTQLRALTPELAGQILGEQMQSGARIPAMQSSSNIPAYQPPANQVQSSPNMPAYQAPGNQVQSSPNMPAYQQPASQMQSSANMPVYQPPAQQQQSGAQIPAMRQPSMQMPALPPNAPPPPPPVAPISNLQQAAQNLRMTRTLEQNPLSDLAYTLLRRSNVITDDLLQVVKDCVQTLERGDISLDQAIEIIRHTCNKHRD